MVVGGIAEVSQAISMIVKKAKAKQKVKVKASSTNGQMLKQCKERGR